MKIERIVFTAPSQAALERAEEDPTLAPDEVLFRTEWTLISSGTELALYQNLNDIGHNPPDPYPIYPGYAAAGTLVEVGPAVAGFSPGDRVFTITSHRSHAKFNPSKTLCLRLPDNLPAEYAVFIRLALVSLATLSRADIGAGEWLGVVGVGLIGNLAAQIGKQAGFHVIGIGRSALRSAVAQKCGIPLLKAENPQAIAAAVNELTTGRGCQLVLDVTGTADGLVKAIALAGKGATISLVGVPWVSETSVTASQIMQPVFTNYLSIKGGWEWDLPLYDKEPGTTLPMIGHRHAIARNAQYALELIQHAKVQLEPLITHRVPPQSAQEAYQGLLKRRNEYLGVLIDWRER